MISYFDQIKNEMLSQEMIGYFCLLTEEEKSDFLFEMKSLVDSRKEVLCEVQRA